jgi:rubrerythrin
MTAGLEVELAAKQFSPEEALACAINAEAEAAKYYQAIADKVSNPDVKKKFESLVADELEHRKTLEAAREKLLGAVTDSLPDPTGGCKVELPPDWQPDKLESAESVIKAAITAEERAAAFYHRASEASKEEEAADIFARLAVMEEGHKRGLQEELDFLTNNQFYWMRASTDQRSMEY